MTKILTLIDNLAAINISVGGSNIPTYTYDDIEAGASSTRRRMITVHTTESEGMYHGLNSTASFNMMHTIIDDAIIGQRGEGSQGRTMMTLVLGYLTSYLGQLGTIRASLQPTPQTTTVEAFAYQVDYAQGDSAEYRVTVTYKIREIL